MPRLLLVLALLYVGFEVSALAGDLQSPVPRHYLFVWAGDRAHAGNDFLAVIDADPASDSYGRLLTTLATDQKTVRVHHTEYSMPAGGMLFANDHDAGRTFIFDLHDALHRVRRNVRGALVRQGDETGVNLRDGVASSSTAAPSQEKK